MKKLFLILFAVAIIASIFTGCARTKDENEPGGVNSNDGSLASNISSMMDSSNMSSMTDGISSMTSSIKDDVGSTVSRVKDGVSSIIN